MTEERLRKFNRDTSKHENTSSDTSLLGSGLLPLQTGRVNAGAATPDQELISPHDSNANAVNHSSETGEVTITTFDPGISHSHE